MWYNVQWCVMPVARIPNAPYQGMSERQMKCSMKNLSLKSGKVVLKKNAPKGTYKFTLTVAASGEWKKTTSKPVSIVVK